jgi:hypothetical protein
MNIHTPEIDRKPTREEAEAALAPVAALGGRASDEEIAALDPSVGNLLPGQGYPALSARLSDRFRRPMPPTRPRCPTCRTARPA